MNTVKISKRISYWLRHDPAQAGLTPDDFGWVPLSQVVAKLNERGADIDEDGIEKLNVSTDKVRFQIDRTGDRIRATHGHSYPVIVGDSQTPPAILYHGTAVRNLESIKAEGLRPMGRQFVHMSTDPDIARTVGARHGKPCVIEVDAAGLYTAGHPMYHTSDNVWLTDEVPQGFLSYEV